ncbi:hypothetical protein [Streptomyces harbinensis]|uniref:hypothetical protein n=1 Tax=Streptomyces harbinensis TaxID=1176198 RepID=UPI0036CBEA52
MTILGKISIGILILTAPFVYHWMRFPAKTWRASFGAEHADLKAEKRKAHARARSIRREIYRKKAALRAEKSERRAAVNSAKSALTRHRRRNDGPLIGSFGSLSIHRHRVHVPHRDVLKRPVDPENPNQEPVTTRTLDLEGLHVDLSEDSNNLYLQFKAATGTHALACFEKASFPAEDVRRAFMELNEAIHAENTYRSGPWQKEDDELVLAYQQAKKVRDTAKYPVIPDQRTKARLEEAEEELAGVDQQWKQRTGIEPLL